MHILIIENEPTAARLLKRELQKQGFDVEVTSSIDSLRTIVCDMLILDAPDRDGWRMCRSVRATGVRVPILMLSSRRRVADRVRGLDAGADGYLTKPFAQRELSAHVRALLRRNGGPGVHPVIVGDLRLDPVARLVSRGRRRVELTSKEFALLEYLMRHAGRPVTRAMIAEHVWGVHWDRLTNTIDVFISHLRRKVDLPADRRLLHAIRGVGYAIGTPAGSLARREDGLPAGRGARGTRTASPGKNIGDMKTPSSSA